MADTAKTPTHTAYVFQRLGRRFGRWEKAGTARLDKDGRVYLDLRLVPVTGFSGAVQMCPIGAPPLRPEPVRDEAEPAENEEQDE
jgi:hypothetical protein